MRGSELTRYLGEADKRLVQATNVLEPLTLEVWILTHPELRNTVRVKALMAVLYGQSSMGCSKRNDTDSMECGAMVPP